MDAGCYCAHSLRFFPGCSRPQVGPEAAASICQVAVNKGGMPVTVSPCRQLLQLPYTFAHPCRCSKPRRQIC
jgi:hypothetical protein